jgi:hypothetical protein
MLQKHFNTQEFAMDTWPYWMLEENIKIVNEILEEEEKQRKTEEDSQRTSMPDTNAMMKNASNLTGNLPKF